jgi:HPt (histidine-containing phosphotransfer) domain-containing protein
MKDEPVISYDSLMAQFDGDRDLFAEVAEIFLEDCPRQMEAIRAALDAGDASGVELAAHTLKGSTSSFAAVPASRAAEALERIGRTGALDGARHAFLSLDAEIRKLEEQLRQLIDAAA